MQHVDNKKTQKTRRFYKNKESPHKAYRLKKSVRLGAISLPEVQPMFKRRGIGNMRIIQDWHHIVGQHLADKTVVDKISYIRNEGILHIKTVGAFATEVSYQSEYIIQKVNTYLGFDAVVAVKIQHTLSIDHIQHRQPDGTDIKHRPPPRTDIETIENIQDENIKNSLRLMAGFVYNNS